MKTKTLTFPAAITAVLLAALAGLSTANAADGTWNNTGTDFNTAGNWTGGVPGAGNTAFFDAAAVTNPNLSLSLSIARVNFSTAASSGYTLSASAGQSLTLTDATPINENNTTGINTISANLILSGGGVKTISQVVGAGLVISGNISETSATSIITNSGFSGTKITLSGSNSFSGGFTLFNSGAQLNIDNANALGTGALHFDSGPLGLLRKDGTPRPAYKAMGEMIRLFGQHPTYLGWVLFNEKHYGFVFQGCSSTVLATWAATTTADDIQLGEPVKIVDPSSGDIATASSWKLSTAPILVDGVPAGLVAQAAANKNKPFPWGGDYSSAKSVSVTMGGKNDEKGLHTQSADSIAADVIAYGGSARAGTVPGGNVFMVDPNFLSYSQTPIEIRVVVRRNEANDPAKLTLEYESTDGYKKAEPYEVPDNKEWHTASWKITDSQFVSMWGFNFRFNTGKYVVQSVTVEKLPTK